MNYPVLIVSFVVLFVCMGLAVFTFFWKRKLEKKAKLAGSESLLDSSTKKVEELELKKETKPLYVFKNGEKKKFVMKKKKGE